MASSGEVEIDESLCAMVPVRIPGSRTRHFVEAFQDQKAGGESAAQISRPRPREDWNRSDSRASNSVARKPIHSAKVRTSADSRSPELRLEVRQYSVREISNDRGVSDVLDNPLESRGLGDRVTEARRTVRC